jgi:uncharacterized membrane protein (DUF2068 family)
MEGMPMWSRIVHFVKEWFQWELHRRIEMTLAIRLIIAERLVKSTALAGVAILFFIEGPGRLRTLLNWVQDRATEGPNSWWRKLMAHTLERFGHLSDIKIYSLAAGVLIYGLVEGTEGVGLIFRRRWAEYLVLITTGVGLPIEIIALIKSVTAWGAVSFGINLAIVVYLIWRKRLFLESPSRTDQQAA